MNDSATATQQASLQPGTQAKDPFYGMVVKTTPIRSERNGRAY